MRIVTSFKDVYSLLCSFYICCLLQVSWKTDVLKQERAKLYFAGKTVNAVSISKRLYENIDMSISDKCKYIYDIIVKLVRDFDTSLLDLY